MAPDANHNLVRFINLSRKKGELFANFRVKGVRKGTTFSATISVVIDAANVDAADSLEKIIEECARLGMREFQASEFEFEGLTRL
jgi:hypothetical protein